MKLILASKSPRRIELMKLVAEGLTADGLLAAPEFEVRPSDFDESGVAEPSPDALVRRLAYEKAAAVLPEAADGDVVIGCDTVVALGNEVFGKPRDHADAVGMIAALSGRTHRVLTGVALLRGGESRCFLESTEVTFHTLSPAEIEHYCATPEPYDKAGGYGIQERGGLFVRHISGDYNNVVGLPSAAVYRALRELLQGETAQNRG